MPTQLPSGNWRPRIRHPRTGKQLNPQTVIGGPSSYPDRAGASAQSREALKVLRTSARAGVTVREWWEEWTTTRCGCARPSRRTSTTASEPRIRRELRRPAGPRGRRRGRARVPTRGAQRRHDPRAAGDVQRRHARRRRPARRTQPVRWAAPPKRAAAATCNRQPRARRLVWSRWPTSSRRHPSRPT